jgi:Glycosyl hydrolases family 25
MAVFYPDVSHYQAGLSLKGARAVSAKATEGTSYLDPSYGDFRSQARALNIPFIPYHYLHSGSATTQANLAFSVAGRDGPLMLDVEAGSGNLTDVLGFVEAYQALGGRVRLVYLPRWYWMQLAQPDLRPVAAAGLLLVSSVYTVYSDSGPGWASYGGVVPAIWQYTDSQPFNGYRVDFNAYRGSFDDFAAALSGDDMAFLDDPNAAALAWRMDALESGSDAVRGGPTKGEPMWTVIALNAMKASLAALETAVDNLATGGVDVDGLAAKTAALVVASHDALTDADKPTIEAAVKDALRAGTG